MKGKTKTGFEFKIDSRILNDVHFLKAYRNLNKDELAVFDIISLLFGDAEDALYEHCTEDGFCDIEKVAAELEDVFNALAEEPDSKKS